MLSPKVKNPMSSRDKVLLQCEQTEPMNFEELLSDRFLLTHSLLQLFNIKSLLIASGS